MDYSAVLEIVISLVAIFWLLSMVCSFAVEAFNSFVSHVRAKALERFVCEMVLGPSSLQAILRWPWWRFGQVQPDDPLGLLSHGLIASLRKPAVSPGGEDHAPSYIPADLFAKVLLDRITSLAAATGLPGDSAAFLQHLAQPGVLDQGWHTCMQDERVQQSGASGLLCASAAIAKAAMASPGDAHARLLALITQIMAVPAEHEPWRSLLMAIVKAMAAIVSGPNVFGTPSAAALWVRALLSLDINSAGLNVVDAVRAVLQHGLLPKALQEAFRPIVANANFDLAQIHKGAEDWYNAVMERASGWFKRHTTALLAASGFALAAGLNINPIAIAQDLARDPALRRAGVAFANQVVQEQGDATLVQKIAFAKNPDLARSIQLLEQADPLSDVNFAPMLKKLVTTRQALLRSGQYAGLWLQTREPQSGDKRTWGDGERNLFLKQVCVAWFEAQSSAGRLPKDAKEPQDILDCPGLAEHFGETQAHLEISKVKTKIETTKTPAPVQAPAGAQSTDVTETTYTTTKCIKPTTASASASGAASSASRAADTDLACNGGQDKEARLINDDLRRFWASDQLVWDTRLATAIWDVQQVMQQVVQCGKACKPTHADAEAASSSPAASQPQAPDPKAALSELLRALKSAQTAAQESSRYFDNFVERLPSLGWSNGAQIHERYFSRHGCADWLRGFCEALLAALIAIVGWTMTALMVSFGAPFWFDLLSKLINRRVTGPRPDSSS